MAILISPLAKSHSAQLPDSDGPDAYALQYLVMANSCLAIRFVRVRNLVKYAETGSAHRFGDFELTWSSQHKKTLRQGLGVVRVEMDRN